LDIDSLLPNFISQFTITLVGLTGETWNYWYGMLLDYVEQVGTSHVNQVVLWRGKALGQWVNKQRTSFRRNQLTQQQVDFLGGLKGWTWDPVDDQKQLRLQALEQFLTREEHARVPARHIEMNLALGDWVSHLRSKYLLSTISTEEKDELESLPGWTWVPLEDDWSEKFGELKLFVENSGGRFPENPRGTDNSGLGKWIVRQRNRYRQNWCSAEQITLLESIPGWSWNPLDENWNSSFELLRAFVAREGHAQPAAKQMEGEYQLGIWVSKQRDRYKKNRVLPHQIVLLESLPSWSWDPLNESWSTFWDSCMKLPSTNTMINRGSIPKDLLEWMKDQRERFQLGKLSPERIKSMELLPGWLWEPRSNLWELIFEDFFEWAQNHDPNSIPKGITFGGANGRSWSENMRTKYRKGLLTEDQISQLESIPRWEWRRQNKQWQENYRAVHQIVLSGELNYRVLPPKTAEWMRTQRKRKLNGTISESEIKLLEQLPGWTWQPPSIAIPGDEKSNPITAAWLRSYETLKLYSLVHKTSTVSVTLIIDEIKIGKWVSHQRQNYKAGKLDTTKISLLEELPDWKWQIH
jgi:hypothetical protein